ncbi:unnamed protein product [Bursaphelenchus okinawaensis]|uniref:Uncharacterized protein n=1 Tax=Bursaphelenchus okinawaensis TaxID=465554 RepID=A0A811KRX1_9BILA|nr:unnamed protein product [Bursaphelenchus okinawaensis]CAG9112103.1 unnamed protein product [Bursaphelenchus okinawaensis]
MLSQKSNSNSPKKGSFYTTGQLQRSMFMERARLINGIRTACVAEDLNDETRFEHKGPLMFNIDHFVIRSEMSEEDTTSTAPHVKIGRSGHVIYEIDKKSQNNYKDIPKSPNSDTTESA